MDTCTPRLKAADAIETRGLAKFALEDESGCLCVGGALNLACYGHAMPDGTKDSSLVYAVVEAMGFGAGWHGWCAMVNWNNDPMTTARDVIARLRDCQPKT